MQTNVRLSHLLSKGTVWFTGEDLAAAALLARLTLVEIEPNSVDLKVVSDLQAETLLPHALADFVRWSETSRKV